MKMKTVLLRASEDPVFFAEAFLGWRAFSAQAEWLRGSVKAQNWCRAGNRWGKTESIAIKHLWHCTFKRRTPTNSPFAKGRTFDAPYETVNTALSLDQAVIPLTKAWRLVHRPAADSYRKVFIRRMVHTPFPRIEFTHGAVWWARSTARKGKYLEGKDYNYVSNDEGALDPNLGYIIDEVLLPRLLDHGGQLDCISTGKRGGEFNRRFEAAKADPDQFAFQGSTLDNPHIDRAALDRLLARLDAALIEERIYGGERPHDGRIPYASIARAIAQGTGLAEPLPGHRYSTGWDLAKSSDYTVGVTLDITTRPYQLVAWEKFNQEGRVRGGVGGEPTSPDPSFARRGIHLQSAISNGYWDYVESRIRERHRRYGGLTQIDATGLGSPIADHLADIGAEAVVFTGQRLIELIGCLELAFGLGLMGIPNLEMALNNGRYWRLVDELEEVEDALSGLDTATALALALWGARGELQGGLAIGLRPRVVGVKAE
jgi:hypothetical protein